MVGARFLLMVGMNLHISKKRRPKDTSRHIIGRVVDTHMNSYSAYMDTYDYMENYV